MLRFAHAAVQQLFLFDSNIRKRHLRMSACALACLHARWHVSGGRLLWCSAHQYVTRRVHPTHAGAALSEFAVSEWSAR